MIRLPFLAGGLAIYFGLRFLSRRRKRSVIRLRNGRRVRLLSSVALLGGSGDELLALEYLSALPDAAPEEVRLEARSLVQTVGARTEFAGYRSALVTVRRPDGPPSDRISGELNFAFRRDDSGSDWYPTAGPE